MKRGLSFLLLLSLSLFVFEAITLSNASLNIDGLPPRGGVGLIPNFYRRFTRCPQAETLVNTIVRIKVQNDSTVPAKLLRLHYHDCFVRGCEASILLDTTNTTNPAEKAAFPNLTLGGFDVIDDIKEEVEKECQGIVSCADILALAARDAVSIPFGTPLWEVPTGRRDGNISLASDVTGNLPSPFSDYSTLQQLFDKKNLTVDDLVALSGAHTIGVAHCGAFSKRLYNFTGKGDMDPSLNATYAETLKKECPNPANPATVVVMDPARVTAFDTSYFSILEQHRGLFQSDAALLTNTNSAAAVNRMKFGNNFLSQFRTSMQKMGAIEVLTRTDGEIRTNCHVVNPPKN
ncbi:hypothetical protein ACH5RR_031177 [Cinchona calisaya]|uniref:Peroxidase n=1 Tax=Cinchona calisaya TaxID=153742 RepID=A0ABD2YIR4_9GENT